MTPFLPLRRRDIAILLLIVGAGLVLRVWLAAVRPLWLDELFSRSNSLGMGYRHLLYFKSAERKHPPLSFLLIKISVLLVRSSAPMVLRSTSLLAGIACIVLAFQLGRAIAGNGFGLLLAALCAVDPLAVNQSAQARMFTLVLGPALYALTHTVVGLREILQGDDRAVRSEALHVAIALAIGIWANLLATTAWCGIVAAALVVAAVPTLVGADRDRAGHVRRRALGFLGWVCGIFLLAAAPCVIRLSRYRNDPSPFPQLSFTGAVGAVIRRLPRLVWLAQQGNTAYGLICLIVLIGILILYRRSRICGILFAVLVLTGLALSLPLALSQRFVNERYLILLLPPLWIGVAAWSLPRGGWKTVAGAVATIGILASQAVASARLLNQWKSNLEFRVLPEIESAKPLRSPADRVVYSGPYVDLYSDYCEPAGFAQLKQPSGNAPVTWIILTRFGKSDEPSALATLRRLGAQYDVSVEDVDLAKEVQTEVVMIGRFAHGHFDLLRFGPDPRTGPVGFHPSL